jgi:transketolase
MTLSRQNLPVLDRSKVEGDAGVLQGAYALRTGRDAVLVATGGEVWVAVTAADQLAKEGVDVGVVSMPSWELFEIQNQAYRDSVLPPGVPTVSVEAGISLGWSKYAQAHVAIDRFGASAPGTEVLEQFGFTASGVAQAVRDLLAG